MNPNTRLKFLYKKALLALHPDKGGDAEIFKSLTNCNNNATSKCFLKY